MAATVNAVAGAIVRGEHPLLYGCAHRVRFHPVSAVTGCIGMVNVSGAWLTRFFLNEQL